MIVARSVAELRGALPAREPGRRRALVPTMGALHEGHLSLVRIARQRAHVVVVSIFVNPIQFGPGEDFATYPRALEADLALLEREGVDAAFCPEAGSFYPPDFSTSVRVKGVSDGQEGAARPGHFDGVATVVTKLFHAAEPDLAVFGRKDLQQAAVVGRMVRDLDFPVEIVVAPVSRDADGLARSSRNVRLSAEERSTAASLPRALKSAARRAAQGAALREVERAARREIEQAGLSVDYVEAVDPQTMRPAETAGAGVALAAAARIGKVRLIDNVLIGQES